MNNENFYNTIIIGAGPAGLTAARYLEDALVLDQKNEIGAKIQCGEAISKKALEFQGIKLDFSWVSCAIHKVEDIMPNNKTLGRMLKKAIGYVLDRKEFEKFLASQSKAKIQLNTKIIDLILKDNLWQIETEQQGIFRCKHLIGADGPNSIVRRKVFQQKLKILPTIEYLIEFKKEIDTRILKFYIDNEKFSGGYAWIFPKSKNTANIGICGKGNLLKIFNEFLENKVKKNYKDYKLLENRSGIIPLYETQLKIFKDKAMLTGDAAGLADPIFKGGMSQAMQSGKIAAQCILENNTHFYEKKIKSAAFASPALYKASKIFYSLNNQILNELGDVLNGKDNFYLLTMRGIIKTLRKSHLRKNFFKLFSFFSIYQKNRDYIF